MRPTRCASNNSFVVFVPGGERLEVRAGGQAAVGLPTPTVSKLCRRSLRASVLHPTRVTCHKNKRGTRSLTERSLLVANRDMVPFQDKRRERNSLLLLLFYCGLTRRGSRQNCSQAPVELRDLASVQRMAQQLSTWPLGSARNMEWDRENKRMNGAAGHRGKGDDRQESSS